MSRSTAAVPLPGEPQKEKCARPSTAVSGSEGLQKTGAEYRSEIRRLFLQGRPRLRQTYLEIVLVIIQAPTVRSSSKVSYGFLPGPLAVWATPHPLKLDIPV